MNLSPELLKNLDFFKFFKFCYRLIKCRISQFQTIHYTIMKGFYKQIHTLPLHVQVYVLIKYFAHPRL